MSPQEPRWRKTLQCGHHAFRTSRGHGIGTARAMQVNATAGAFAGLAMGINALATALLLPIAWHFVFGR